MTERADAPVVSTGPMAAVRVFVTDLTAATGFYRDTLGLTVTATGEGWSTLDLGGPSMVVETADPSDEEEAALIGRFLGLSLQVEDAAAAHAALAAANVPMVGPPAPQAWGGVLLHVFDPSDNMITLVQPASESPFTDD